MLNFLVYLLILVLVFGLIAMLIRWAPVDDRFKQIAIYVLLVVFVLFVIVLLLGLVGAGPVVLVPPNPAVR